MPVGHVCTGGTWAPGKKVACARCSTRLRREAIYSDARWHRCRRAVREAAGYRCVICGRHEAELEPHESLLADHWPVPVLELADPFNPAWCRCVCSRCGGSADGQRAHV